VKISLSSLCTKLDSTFWTSAETSISLSGRRTLQPTGFLGLKTSHMLFLAFVDSVESLLQRLQAKLWLSTLVLVTKPVAILSATTLRTTAL
jgi:hypothetical protein